MIALRCIAASAGVGGTNDDRCRKQRVAKLSAERFVRTLKKWLADKVWIANQELAHLLVMFRTDYNDRPHQGIAIPGLVPNETSLPADLVVLVQSVSA
jgi:hypothetical protein